MASMEPEPERAREAAIVLDRRGDYATAPRELEALLVGSSMDLDRLLAWAQLHVAGDVREAHLELPINGSLSGRERLRATISATGEMYVLSVRRRRLD